MKFKNAKIRRARGEFVNSTSKFSPVSPKELQLPPEIAPKYITFERLEAEYSISKGRAYPLIANGRIKVVRLLEPGKSRGKVLILVASVEAYLKSLEVPA
jgi:hypothetical protein